MSVDSKELDIESEIWHILDEKISLELRYLTINHSLNFLRLEKNWKSRVLIGGADLSWNCSDRLVRCRDSQGTMAHAPHTLRRIHTNASPPWILSFSLAKCTNTKQDRWQEERIDGPLNNRSHREGGVVVHRLLTKPPARIRRGRRHLRKIAGEKTDALIWWNDSF